MVQAQEPYHRDVSSLLASQRKDSVINPLRHGSPGNKMRYTNTYSMYKVNATLPSCCAMADLYCSVLTASSGGEIGDYIQSTILITVLGVNPLMLTSS